METIKNILNFLDGKKSTIASIASLIIVFLMQQTYISQNVGLLLQGILSIITGGAIIATSKLGVKRYK